MLSFFLTTRTDILNYPLISNLVENLDETNVKFKKVLISVKEATFSLTEQFQLLLHKFTEEKDDITEYRVVVEQVVFVRSKLEEAERFIIKVSIKDLSTM